LVASSTTSGLGSDPFPPRNPCAIHGDAVANCAIRTRLAPVDGGTRVAPSNAGDLIMQTPLQIRFRDMEPSPALAVTVRDCADRLERHFARVVSCRVFIQASNKDSQKRLFEVMVDLAIPGREIVIEKHHADRASHEDAHVAVRDAFEAAQRVLGRYVESRREAARAP
jgi:putative sigma-54 modulation protein